MKIIFLFLLSFNVYASFEMLGDFTLNYKHFKEDEVERTKDQSLALAGRLSTKYDGEKIDTSFGGFFRVDGGDTDRNLVRIEDAYVIGALNEEESARLLAGYKIYNWTAMEVFHPVDVINSRNFDSDLEKLEKFGELSLALELDVFAGELHFYYFPKYEDAHYPGDKSRLGAGVDLGKPVWVDDETDNDYGHQWGARFSTTIGDSDISVHVLNHMDRNHPVIGTSRYLVAGSNLVPLETPVIPHHFRVIQYGGTIQSALPGGWLFKAEGAYLDYTEDKFIYTIGGLRKAEDHAQLALGLEYSLSHKGGGSSNFFFESQRIFDLEKRKRADVMAFQNDIALGWRYAFNDIMGSEFYFFFVTDLERSQEHFINSYFTRRLTDALKYKIGLRLFDAPQKGNRPIGLELLDDDHHFNASLTYYF